MIKDEDILIKEPARLFIGNCLNIIQNKLHADELRNLIGNLVKAGFFSFISISIPQSDNSEGFSFEYGSSDAERARSFPIPLSWGDEGVLKITAQTPLSDEDGLLMGYVAGTTYSSAMEFTGRAEYSRSYLENRLLYAQRLAALGPHIRETVHGLNNIFTTLIGNLSFIQESLEDEPDISAQLDEMDKQLNAAVELSASLRAFIKGDCGAEPKPVYFGKLVSDMTFFFKTCLSGGVVVKFNNYAGRSVINGCAGALRQMTMNLLMNAREACEPSGTVKIALRNVEKNEKTCTSHSDLSDGHYVILTVTDTGNGFTEESLQRVKEPFYSTKPGHFGLGLTIASMIAREHKGCLALENSEEGGAVVSACLPVAD